MKDIKLVFAPSTSEDVVKYRLAWAQDADDLGFAGYVEFPKDQIPTNSEELMVFNLREIPGTDVLDGTYTFGIVAIDDADNFSEWSIVEEVDVDFLAPEPPGPIYVQVG